jgi:hypothetical protein
LKSQAGILDAVQADSESDSDSDNDEMNLQLTDFQ